MTYRVGWPRTEHGHIISNFSLSHFRSNWSTFKIKKMLYWWFKGPSWSSSDPSWIHYSFNISQTKASLVNNIHVSGIHMSLYEYEQLWRKGKKLKRTESEIFSTEVCHCFPGLRQPGVRQGNSQVHIWEWMQSVQSPWSSLASGAVFKVYKKGHSAMKVRKEKDMVTVKQPSN